MSGFTDPDYVEFTRFFQEDDRVLPVKKSNVVAADAMTPPMWFEPTEVSMDGQADASSGAWKMLICDYGLQILAVIACVEETSVVCGYWKH